MHLNKVIDFLSQLESNNSREWFLANKGQFEQARTEISHLFDTLHKAIVIDNPDLALLTYSQSVFRLNRDVRFSKDKTPYKTHFGIFLAPQGKNSGNAGYYLHISPAESFASAGIYMPSPEKLKKIRNEIYYNYQEIIEILQNPDFVTAYGGLHLNGDELKKVPKPFPIDAESGKLLRFKHFYVIHPFSSDEVLSSEFPNKVIGLFQKAKAFVEFLNKSLHD